MPIRKNQKCKDKKRKQQKTQRHVNVFISQQESNHNNLLSFIRFVTKRHIRKILPACMKTRERILIGKYKVNNEYIKKLNKRNEERKKELLVSIGVFENLLTHEIIKIPIQKISESFLQEHR